MAHYLVRAKPMDEKLVALKAMIDAGEIKPMRPFGNTLHHSLAHARLASNGEAVWEEEDYCSPPLRMERAAVLDAFFTELRVEKVRAGEGWERIENLSSLWKSKEMRDE